MDPCGSKYSLVAGFCKDGIENPNAGKARKFLMSWTTSDTGLFGYCLCCNLRNVFRITADSS
jgi:hypothetical protein